MRSKPSQRYQRVWIVLGIHCAHRVSRRCRHVFRSRDCTFLVAGFLGLRARSRRCDYIVSQDRLTMVYRRLAVGTRAGGHELYSTCRTTCYLILAANPIGRRWHVVESTSLAFVALESRDMVVYTAVDLSRPCLRCTCITHKTQRNRNGVRLDASCSSLDRTVSSFKSALFDRLPCSQMTLVMLNYLP